MPLATASTEADMIENIKLLAREFTDRLATFARGQYGSKVGPNGQIRQTSDTSTPKGKMAGPAFLVKYNCDLYVESSLWDGIRWMAWGTEASGNNPTTFAKGRATTLSRPILDLIQPVEADMGRGEYIYQVGGYAKVAGDAGYDPGDPIINLEFKLESRDVYEAEFTNKRGERKTRPNTPYASYILNVHAHKKWAVPEFMLNMDMDHIND